jgi:hypothetical protein
MKCLRCAVVAMRRDNAMLREEQGWFNLPTLCADHGALKSLQLKNAMLKAQARNVELDEAAVALERERRKAGATLAGATVERKLAFPYGRAVAPLQGQTYRPELKPAAVVQASGPVLSPADACRQAMLRRAQEALEAEDREDKAAQRELAEANAHLAKRFQIRRRA